MASAGAANAARIPDRTELGRFAEAYAVMRAELEGARYAGARGHLQDLPIQRAAALGRREQFEPAEVRTIFANGSPATRVLALALMKATRRWPTARRSRPRSRTRVPR